MIGTLLLVLLLNWLSHFFLVRLFKWYDPKSRLNSKVVKWILLVPPLALVLAVFLISLGLILRVFGKKKRKK
jgi:hypothetical protein